MSKIHFSYKIHFVNVVNVVKIWGIRIIYYLTKIEISKSYFTLL